MTHASILKYAWRLWWVPLLLGTLVLFGFLLTDDPVFAIAGYVLLVVGMLCTLAGVIMVLIILTRLRKNPATNPDGLEESRAWVILLLLCINFPIAGSYVVLGMERKESLVSAVADSPDSSQVAEVHYLGENANPPYGQAVSLRPAWNPLRTHARTIVFSGHCDGGVKVEWKTDKQLMIYCQRPKKVHVKRLRHEAIRIKYVNT